VNQPQFKAVIGEFKFCKKMAAFDPKKFAEFQGTVSLKDYQCILFIYHTVETCTQLHFS
jgi:hypothetical protein